MDRAQRVAVGSIPVSLAALAMKTAGWWLTGSSAIFSDALETLVNVAAAVLTLAALRLAVKPADENHPFGHAKAEFFAAVTEGALIVGAAAIILQEAWHVWRHAEPLTLSPVGIGLTLAGAVVNGLWAVFLLRAGRETRSPALAADGRHLMADVLTSLGVVAGIGLVFATGLSELDPLLAALVAVYILGSGFHLIRESVGGLMDEATDPAMLARIRTIVAEQAAGAIEAHDLRTRRAGRTTFLEFHLVVPGAMSVADAHVICDRIEGALKSDLRGLVPTIHVEPEGKAKHHGVVVL